MAAVIAYTISFTMAFLLFVVQPMATKVILPQFGGTPAVWNTAMLCFQLLLLLGYIYAHVLTSALKPKFQIITHAVLILLACVVLPVVFVAPSTQQLSHEPIRSLIWELLQGVGLQFFCVAATAPLLQRWVSYSNSSLAAKPYVLYSASNLGSMSALIGYILLIEPNATVSHQIMGWGYLFAAVSLVFVVFAYCLSGKAEGVKTERLNWSEVSIPRSLLWVFLAFVPSSLSLGLTSHITTDIASVPFFWVLPFAIYLLSFVDAFASRPIIVPIAKYIAPGLSLFCLLAMCNNSLMRLVAMYMDVMVLHVLTFTFLAFAIHGYLAERKPNVTQLTWYYVCMSIGGALGGVFNAIAAPMLLDSIFEYPMMMFVGSMLSFIILRARHANFRIGEEGRFILTTLGMLLLASALAYNVYEMIYGRDHYFAAGWIDGATLSMAMCFASIAILVMRRTYRAFFYSLCITCFVVLAVARIGSVSMLKERNFYGVSRVYENPETKIRYLQHNTTIHGIQSLVPESHLKATSYYSGLEEIMAHRLPSVAGEPIGAIGLGIGIVKCQTKPEQHMDIYEINPLVVEIAEDEDLFTYLSDCPGKHDIVLGDGRLTMAQMPHEKYGTIVIDAFSSDAIPVHLLTKEAMQMYLDKLKPGGIIVIHVTNRHLDLRPLLAVQSEAVGAVAYQKFFRGEGDLNFSAFWVVLARNDATLAPLLTGATDWHKLLPEPDAKPWTDDYTNILPYLEKMR